LKLLKFGYLEHPGISNVFLGPFEFEITWFHCISIYSVTVVDDKGEQAAPVDVAIVLCSGCSGNGDCNYNNIRSSGSDMFSYAECDCNMGYSGKLLNHKCITQVSINLVEVFFKSNFVP
jgi:hypothetical protein